MGERKTVAVFTRDVYLFQKIKLELYGSAVAVLCERREDAAEADITLVDADSREEFIADGIKMTRHGAVDNEIPIPFPLGFIERLIGGEDSQRSIQISDTERCALLHGRRIRLTEVEYSLLKLLIDREGEFVSREELLEKVWNNSADGGVINVYIHYLREKLETGGEKIIISSRKHGYKISENFTGGRDA